MSDGNRKSRLEKIPAAVVKGMAWDYHIKGHYCLDYEDLVSEGFMLAVSMLETLAEEDFKHMFRRALKNRFLNMLRSTLSLKRHAIVVDLSEALELIGQEGLEELWTKKKLDALEKMLSPRARKLLLELVSPGEKTLALSREEHRKQNKKYSEGRHGLKRSWKIRTETIQKSLQMSARELLIYEVEIRRAIWEV